MTEQSPFRLAMLGMLLIGLFVSLFARMWYLQVVTEQREVAQSQAEQNLLRTVFVEAPRGRVLDRSGNVLIDNRLVNEVIIDKFTLGESIPGEADRREFAIKLAREISSAGRLIKASDIENALTDRRFGPFDRVPIATDVPERFSILIGEREDDFPGVRVRKTTVRSYPYGARASHLLGYVGPVFQEDLAGLRDSPKLYQPTDVIGRAGVEKSLEDILRGTPGVEVIEVDANGNRVREVSASDPIPGNDVQLTLDINLQVLVEEELANGIRTARTRVNDFNQEELELFKAPGGAMVLLDPDGSRILAMASFPTYDQRIFLQEVIPQREFDQLQFDPNAPLLDRATQSEYAPGSTFKLITAYAALDTGLLGERGFLKRRQFLQDNGFWQVEGCTGPGCRIENAGQKALGDVDLERAITESSNVYFGQLGFQFDVRRGYQATQLLEVAADFGYGQFTDAIADANQGALPEPPTAGASANLAVGQGAMIATPLQIANSYGALANGGTVFAPMLAEAAIDPATDEIFIDYEPRVVNELYMPSEFYDPLINGMIGVTAAEDGTAVEAFENFPLGRFRVIGKTGTVENPPRQDNAVFAAIGPWPNPEYAAVVYLEQAGLGGDQAAPVVAAVMQRIADGDIEVVPTEAEADDLISEADALAEEERLQSEQEALRDAENAADTAESDGPGFQVLVPGADQVDEGEVPSTRGERAEVESEEAAGP